MLILQRLWFHLRAPLRGLRALVQLPSQLRQWQITQQEQIEVVRETNDLFRELLIAIGEGPQTPATPRLHPVEPPSSSLSSGPVQSSALQPVPPPEPANPKRIRTARDVTYSSRAFLREQDARVEAAQAPWRTPGA